VSYEPDSKVCSLVVASYTDIAQIVGAVTTATVARLLMSPVLGDFIELRSVDIGVRPEGAADRSSAVTRLADELTRPARDAVENYFGLVIIDSSASTVDHLLEGCRLDPTIAALPLRQRGLSVLDDRSLPLGEGDDRAEISIPESGEWTHRAMVDELRGYADSLLRHFANAHRPGLTREELVSLRYAHESLPPLPRIRADDDPVLDLTPALPDPEPAPAAPTPRRRRCRLWAWLFGRGSA
jgi:hypothetical protein